MAVGHRWQKGAPSPNPKGRPRKGRSLTEALETIALDRAEDLADAAMDLALGHWVSETTPKGERRVYFAPPNIAAINFVFDRIDGKVATKIDLSLIIRRAAEAHGLAPDDPLVIAAIAEAEGVMREARG